MPENKRKNVKNLEFRARLPLYVRGFAVFGLIITVLIIGLGFYLSRNNREFRMKNFPAALSKDVVAEVSNYERRETEDGVLKYYLKADHARTFADNHQELENVFLQVFDETGAGYDTITANKAVYIPAENKNFTAYFAGNVNIQTRDALIVKTEQLTYTKENEIAEAEEAVYFERENVSGKSNGARVLIRDKRLELLRDVEIDAFESPELAGSNIKYARIAAGSAVVDQNAEKIEFVENVAINITPDQSRDALAQPTDIHANRATAFFTNKQVNKIDLDGNVEVFQKPTANNRKWTRAAANRATAKINKELKSVEMFENVRIETTVSDEQPTKINSGYAVYEKDADRFELKNAVHIITVEDKQPTDIKASEAVYEQKNGKIFLNGNAEITQGAGFIKGDNLTADLFPNKKVKFAAARGNAYLKQNTNERLTEISAPELNAAFNESQHLQSAESIGASSVNLIPVQAEDYTKIALSAPDRIRLNFQANGLLQEMQTDGRTTIQLNAPNNAPDSANKRLTADKIKTVFQNDGKNMARAEAVGNAELFVEPLRALPENYKTTVTVPRFDCDFFQTGNNAKNCAAATGAKAVRAPTVSGSNRANQTLTAEKLNAIFNQQTRDIEQFDAVGNTKFVEADRSGIANQFTFTAKDEFVRLRGGEPTVWDSRARAKAAEIDWDTKNEKSFLRGNVSTTYYSQKQTGGATPFAATGAPVFLTAENAEFDHRAETAVYTGNARAWQENNYVRAERLLLQQNQGQLFAEGAVQSLLYDTKQKNKNVPVHASAGKMSYNRENRVLRYEDNVDIRQGTDRITAGAANVFLDAKNELARTVVEKSVVVTQPNRRATGDWAQYTAENEIVILRGNPARIEDAESGASQGAQMTVYMRENRVVGESKTTQTNSSGRIRSVFKIKKNE
jgi:LPS export ABC transporter protein LptC/lipopolysaccharide transport protein LptA